MDNSGVILLVDNDLYLNNAMENEFYRLDYRVITATTYDSAKLMMEKTPA